MALLHTFFSRKIFERSSGVSPLLLQLLLLAGGGESSALGNHHIFSKQRSLTGPKVTLPCVNKQTSDCGHNANTSMTRSPKRDWFKRFHSNGGRLRASVIKNI